MKRSRIGLILVLLMATALAAGCWKTEEEPAPVVSTPVADIDLPATFFEQVRDAGSNLRLMESQDEEGNFVKRTGVTIDVPHDEADAVARRLQESVPPDYIAFVSERHYGIVGDPDQVSVLQASSMFDVLEVMNTNGWNYDISPEMVIARIKEWDQRYGLVLLGASFDWLEAEFRRPPTDMTAFAMEVYEFCPDVVDQGTETVEALAAEMKRTNVLYLWWD